jgi:endonuclease-3
LPHATALGGPDERFGTAAHHLLAVTKSTTKPEAGKSDAVRIVRKLRAAYPQAECALQFDTPVQLLVATILSAQCTDERVNQVTDKLFRRWPTAHDLARLSQRTLEKAIQSTGFFRNKAKNIRACCAELAERYNGQVPRDLTTLVALPGVGRKTANVVLGTAYGLTTGVVVDTHVGRISRRLGLTRQSDPVKIELDLMRQLPRREWVMFSHRVIHHGRGVCKARKPDCEACCLRDLCPRIGVAATGIQAPAGAARRPRRGRSLKVGDGTKS